MIKITAQQTLSIANYTTHNAQDIIRLLRKLLKQISYTAVHVANTQMCV